MKFKACTSKHQKAFSEMIDNTQLLSKLTGLLYMLELNYPYEIGLSYRYKIHE